MSLQEKRTLYSILTNILISIIYCYYVFQFYDDYGLNSTNDFRYWGASILLFVPLQIVTKISYHILFAIIVAIVNRGENCKEYDLDKYSIKDELENLIESKSTNNTFIVFGSGFLLSMGALVLHMSPTVMFEMLLFSLILGGISGEISQFYFYRKGVYNG